MTQKLKTPDVSVCARCGSPAHPIDWTFREMWQVHCDKGHVYSGGECITRHRAICRWNNEQEVLRKAEESVKVIRERLRNENSK